MDDEFFNLVDRVDVTTVVGVLHPQENQESLPSRLPKNGLPMRQNHDAPATSNPLCWKNSPTEPLRKDEFSGGH